MKQLKFFFLLLLWFTCAQKVNSQVLTLFERFLLTLSWEQSSQRYYGKHHIEGYNMGDLRLIRGGAQFTADGLNHALSDIPFVSNWIDDLLGDFVYIDVPVGPADYSGWYRTSTKRASAWVFIARWQDESTHIVNGAPVDNPLYPVRFIFGKYQRKLKLAVKQAQWEIEKGKGGTASHQFALGLQPLYATGIPPTLRLGKSNGNGKLFVEPQLEFYWVWSFDERYGTIDFENIVDVSALIENQFDTPGFISKPLGEETSDKIIHTVLEFAENSITPNTPPLFMGLPVTNGPEIGLGAKFGYERRGNVPLVGRVFGYVNANRYWLHHPWKENPSIYGWKFSAGLGYQFMINPVKKEKKQKETLRYF